MLQLKTFQCNPLQENTYVLFDSATLDAVVIDCGALFLSEREAVSSYISQQRLHVCHLLLTHGHLDHCFGCATLAQELGLPVRVHDADRPLVADLSLQARQLFGMPYGEPSPLLGDALADGDAICFGPHTLQVIHTPGHTPGGVVFYCPEERIAFTGDTLFRMSVGRTDFPGGSWQQLIQSLSRLASTLPTGTTLYTGHGPATTIDDERSYNPYMKTD